MCGIFGVYQGVSRPLDPASVAAAFEVQSHRGPDSSGQVSFEIDDRKLVLGHQRLSIIDLSEAGDQPMTYGTGQGCLVYNGELYNYLELRSELQARGLAFVSDSDSEVLLAALHQWGPATALGKFNWMGAFAWYDRDRQRLVLARDSGSEKPLYYFVGDGRLLFASEVKTLLTLANRKFSLNRDVVARFLFQGLTDASPQTFFDGVSQLVAGTYSEIDLTEDCSGLEPVPYRPPVYSDDPQAMALPEFVREVRRLFVDSVRLRLRSDVPVGVLLSGGIDSSAIAAVSHAENASGQTPHLLSAVSDDPRFDESKHISAMERHLSAKAHRVTLRTDPDVLVDELSRINWFNDAPVTGLSELGHYRMMERAKQLGLTVILSGQGADEILLGYRKFLGFYLQSLIRGGRVVKAMAVLASFVGNRSMVNQFRLGEARRYVPLLQRIGRSRRDEESGEAVAGEWLEDWRPADVGLGSGTLADRQLLDIKSLSVPALCHYEDRMSMSQSREIRLPFLDSRLIDLLIRAPDDYKIRRGWTKYCFRRAMEEMLPAEIAWRRDKMGFTNPQGEWLKSELRGVVTEAFSSHSLLAQKRIVNSDALLRKYARYCKQAPAGGLIWYREIFAPLSLEIWLRRYGAWVA